MKALLKTLLLLLCAGVWGQIAPSASADGGERGSPGRVQDYCVPDCEGLPGTPSAPEAQRSVGDPNARADTSAQAQTARLEGGSCGANPRAESCIGLLARCGASAAAPVQAHLRTNGSADANGSRA